MKREDLENELELGGYVKIFNGDFIRNISDSYRWHAKIIDGKIELHKDARLKNGKHKTIMYEGYQKEMNRIKNKENKLG